jgi:hypothetical protein
MHERKSFTLIEDEKLYGILNSLQAPAKLAKSRFSPPLSAPQGLFFQKILSHHT